MSWVKLDDVFPEHGKIEQAGEAAGWMFVCGLCYCSRALTDGFIPAGRVRRLTSGRYPERTATALVSAGLWHRVEGGFEVHNYLDYQVPADEAKAKRRANAERQGRFRERRRNADSNALHAAVVTDSPARDARVGVSCKSVSKGSTETIGVDARTVFDAWVLATERDAARTKLDAKRRRIIEKALASHGRDDCLAAVTNIGRDAWARGANDRGRRFDDIEHALGNAERIEKWRDWTPSVQSGKSAEAERSARRLEWLTEGAA